MKSRKSKTIFIIIIAVTILCLSIMSTIQRFRELNYKFISFYEKRDPITFENVSDGDTSVSEFELFFNDTMPLRRQMITAYSNTMHSLDVMVYDGSVVNGKNGYMFLKVYQDDHRGLNTASDDEIGEALANIAKLKEYTDSIDLEMVVFIVPDKATVYSEYLPDWYTSTGQISDNAMLMDVGSQDTQGYIVDVESTLMQAKSEYGDLLYHRTDSHVSTLGAYISYRSVIDYLSIQQDMDIVALGLRSYEVIENTDGYHLLHMAALTRSVDDFATVLTYKDEHYAQSVSQYRSGDKYYYNPSALNNKTVLYIGDSFSEMQVPLFVNTFDRAYFYQVKYDLDSLRDQGRLEELIEQTQPDILVLERVERECYNFFDNITR